MTAADPHASESLDSPDTDPQPVVSPAGPFADQLAELAPFASQEDW